MIFVSHVGFLHTLTTVPSSPGDVDEKSLPNSKTLQNQLLNPLKQPFAYCADHLLCYTGRWGGSGV